MFSKTLVIHNPSEDDMKKLDSKKAKWQKLLSLPLSKIKKDKKKLKELRTALAKGTFPPSLRPELWKKILSEGGAAPQHSTDLNVRYFARNTNCIILLMMVDADVD